MRDNPEAFCSSYYKVPLNKKGCRRYVQYAILHAQYKVIIRLTEGLYSPYHRSR